MCKNDRESFLFCLDEAQCDLDVKFEDPFDSLGDAMEGWPNRCMRWHSDTRIIITDISLRLGKVQKTFEASLTQTNRARNSETSNRSYYSFDR